MDTAHFQRVCGQTGETAGLPDVGKRRDHAREADGSPRPLQNCARADGGHAGAYRQERKQGERRACGAAAAGWELCVVREIDLVLVLSPSRW